MKVDTDQLPQLAKQFGVVGLPDIRLLKQTGEEHGRLTDFQDAEQFAKALSELLEANSGPKSQETLTSE